MSQDEKTFKGQCLCGAVTIVVTGDPEGAGYSGAISQAEFDRVKQKALS